MSYDPDFPVDDSLIEALPFRNQFHSLKDLIDAINVILSATVDGVNTINFGDPATATASLVGNVLHFTFSIPQGQQGIQGYQGEPGAVGPPFAQALIDAVNTLDPGQPATAGVYFDGISVHFTFGIPRGADGGQGIQGEQGTPGEVTNAALASAISGTSNNSNTVTTLDTPFADPDAEALRAAYNALVLSLRR